MYKSSKLTSLAFTHFTGDSGIYFIYISRHQWLSRLALFTLFKSLQYVLDFRKLEEVSKSQVITGGGWATFSHCAWPEWTWSSTKCGLWFNFQLSAMAYRVRMTFILNHSNTYICSLVFVGDRCSKRDSPFTYSRSFINDFNNLNNCEYVKSIIY